MSAKALLDNGTVEVSKSVTARTPVALLGYRELEVREACQILILSEDFFTYERAVEACRRMQVQLDDDLGIDFKSGTFSELADPDRARVVFKDARSADVILFSIQGADLPAAAVEWLESLPAFRSRSEGALALILNTPANAAAVEKLVLWMEQSARVMGMDFLQLAALPVERKAMQALFKGPAEFVEPREWDHWGLNE